MSILIESPLSVPLGRKRQFILNLNNFRNLYFRSLNQAKIIYKMIMKERLKEAVWWELDRVGIIYQVHKGDKRKYDVGNVASIHQKFFEDALTELGYISDDNKDNIPITAFVNGELDKGNPRVDIYIYNLKDKTDTSKFYKDLRQYGKDVIKKK